MKTNRTVVGVDTAKRVFQLHWVDMETGEIVDLRLMRAKFLEHFANRAPCLVAMEACGGSQHWARRIRELGHEVRLLPAKMVRPFVGGNKNDAHDARAIWTAVQQPGIKTVAIKSEEQQAILALHRMRQQLVKFRTAQINGLRGLLTEYGEVMPKGRAGMRRDIAAALERVSERLPAMVIETLREQWARVVLMAGADEETIDQTLADLVPRPFDYYNHRVDTRPFTRMTCRRYVLLAADDASLPRGLARHGRESGRTQGVRDSWRSRGAVHRSRFAGARPGRDRARPRRAVAAEGVRGCLQRLERDGHKLRGQPRRA